MYTQENVNWTIDYLKRLLADASYGRKWTRFGAKQCWVSDCIKNRYFLVKSYNTIVAIIDDQNGELFELGKWSPTTSKQVTQLYNLRDAECYSKFGFSELKNRYLYK